MPAPTIVSAAPALVAAMVDQLTSSFAAPGSGFEKVDVLDGPGLSDDRGDSLQVGVADPSRPEGLTVAAQGAETPGPFGGNRPRDENGWVVLSAESWASSDDGAADMRAARGRVYAIAGAVAAAGRQSPTWGVQHVLWTGYGALSSLSQDQDSQGAHAVLTFRVSFRARL